MVSVLMINQIVLIGLDFVFN